MTDYFALLDEPRRPWLDAEALKQKFLSRSAQVHPDRVHNLSDVEKRAADQHYKELNAAFMCLREPRDRLRHLLELERGERPAELQEVPPQLAELCMHVGKLCREADRFAAELAQLASPLLRVQRFAEGQELTAKLMALQGRVSNERELALGELERLDARWDDVAARRQVSAELERLYRLLGFFLRWTVQIQERIVRLTI